MKTNTFENMLEHNPVRNWVRELMEVKPMRSATSVESIDRGLHVACGNGSSTQLILKHFPVKRMSAVDRDDGLIEAARAEYRSDALDFSAQDVRSLSFPDSHFDAVFDLADLHNFSDWRQGIAEIRRVLRSGGLLILEEISRETFSHAAGRVFKALTEHPYDSMLTFEGLHEYLLETGFEILHMERKNPLGLFRYLIVVARKAEPRNAKPKEACGNAPDARIVPAGDGRRSLGG